MSVGRDVIGNLDGAGQILRIPRARSAPDAIDSISQEMVKFMSSKRTDQSMGTYIMEFEMLRICFGPRRICFGPVYRERGVAQELKNHGAGKFRQHIGLPSGVGADATLVWAMWICIATRRNGGAGNGYGVRIRGF